MSDDDSERSVLAIQWERIKAEVEAPLRGEIKRLREHVQDIAAHATPCGDLPNEPGWVGTYLLTAGALHRALGTLGYSAPSCAAEADRDRWRQVADRLALALDRLSRNSAALLRGAPVCDVEETDTEVSRALAAYEAAKTTSDR